jgi:hypothetical protein
LAASAHDQARMEKDECKVNKRLEHTAASGWRGFTDAFGRKVILNQLRN